MGELVTTPRAAEELGITRQQVVNLIKDGVLTAETDERGYYRLDVETARREYAEHKRLSDLSGLSIPRGYSRPRAGADDLTRKDKVAISCEVDKWYDWGVRVELLNCAYRIAYRVFSNADIPEGVKPFIRDAVRHEINSSLKAIETFDGAICADMPQRLGCPKFGSAETCEVLENGGDCYGNDGNPEAVCLAEPLHFAEYLEETDSFRMHDPINPGVFDYSE